jgi:two-component system sporulation sensor kinase A
LDLNYHVVYVNRTYEQTFGWKQDELLGKKTPIFTFENANEQEAKLSHLLYCDEHINLETCLKCKDGKIIDVHVVKTPIINESGEYVASSLILKDISCLRKTEELLRKSEKLSVAGQLAAGLAHEIRNPLTSLRGFLQLLQSDLNHRNKHYFDIMLAELDQINFIVSEFLAVTRPETIHFNHSDLKSILQSVFELLKTHGMLYGAELQLVFKTDIVPIICSRMHLRQLFINLIKNSIEAIQREGIVRIEVSMPDQEHIQIAIIDNGIGIPEACMKQLGEPFFTTKEKGTGLGLMMCYKIVKSHQGKMTITSQEGQGTTIEVLLPIQPAPTES